MKTHWILLAGLLWGAPFAWSQEDPPPAPHETPPPHGEPGFAPDQALDAPAARLAGPRGQDVPPVQRLLDVLRERNPEEFERMRRLRQEDPEAFRQELGRRLREERERRGLTGSPGDGEFRHPFRGGPVGEGGRGMEVRSPATDRLERKAHELAQQLKSSVNEDEQLRLRAELRATLVEGFDAREQVRRERLAQMESRIQKIRDSLAQRAANRDAIVDKRLQELTDGDAMAW